MPNTTVPAAATGLPKFSRRSVLGGLAAATAATVTVAQAATSAEAADLTQPAEPKANPELVALFGDLKKAVAEKAAAEDAKEWLVDEWRHRWPQAPEEITLPGWAEWDDNREVDLAGRPIVRPGEKYARRLRSIHNLTIIANCSIALVAKARTEKDRARKLAKEAAGKRGLDLGEEYYGQIERVKEASGIRSADARLAAAHRAIDRLSKEIMASPASSLSCLAIKAEAVEIWGEDTGYPFQKETAYLGWPYRFASDIRNVAAGGVS